MSNQLEAFIRAIHRRWVIWRALERVGIGVLISCAAAAMLYPILLWRGEPAMPMIFGALGLGAVCGAIFGFKSRPTLMDTAIEADRQLNLHDLLASALAVRTSLSHADEWSAAVITMAEAKCHGIAPRDVILNRLGVRAWGGIGLSAAIMLTLGILSTNPIVTQAVASVNGRAVARTTSNSSSTPDQLNPARNTSDSKSASVEPKDDDHSQISEPNNSRQASANASSNHRSTAADGAGSGQSKTESKPTTPLANSASPSIAQNENGTRIASGGAANARLEGAGDRAGSNVAEQQGDVTPPWQSSNWSSAREQALREVREGKTPAVYHDLIRDYFNRDNVDH